MRHLLRRRIGSGLWLALGLGSAGAACQGQQRPAPERPARERPAPEQLNVAPRPATAAEQALIERLENPATGAAVWAAAFPQLLEKPLPAPAGVPLLAGQLTRAGSGAQVEGIRLKSVQALAHYGIQAASAVPALLDILENPQASAELQKAAVGALGAIGPGVPAVVPGLAQSLIDDGLVERLAVRQAVAQTLGGMGPAARAAIPALGIELTRAVPETAGEVAQRAAQNAVFEALGRIAQDDALLTGLTVEALTARLGNLAQTSPAEAAVAFLALQKAGKQAAPALPALVAILTERPENYLRLAAIKAMARIGPGASAEAVTALLDTLAAAHADGDVPLREAVVAALGAITPDDAAAMAPLTAALQRPEAEVRLSAASQLIRLRPASEASLGAVLKTLEAALDETQRNVRLTALRLLAQVGPAARPVAPRLLRELRQTWPQASGDDGPLALLHAVEAAALPQDAALALVDLLEAPPKTTPHNEYSLREWRANLFTALARIGLPADKALRQRALKVTLTALADHDAIVQVGAARVAALLGTAGREAVPLLARLLDPQASVSPPDSPLWEFNNELHWGYVSTTSVPREAVLALVQLGPVAVAAVPALQRLAADAALGDDARHALQAIQAGT